MNQNSKKHHFNPQHILNNFVLDDTRKLFVLDKSNGNSFASTPKDAGHENHFNSVTCGGQRLNLESIFEKSDARQSALITKILQVRDLNAMTSEERLDLAELVVLQMLRVKILRNNIREIPTLLRKAFGHMGVDQEIAPDITENAAKALSFQMLKGYRSYIPFVLAKNWSIGVAPSNKWLWTSDNPICLSNDFSSGDPGIAAQGAIIQWPIAKDVMLQFSCSSIANKVAQSNGEKAGEFLRSDPTLSLQRIQVEQLNLNQVVNATRFVYSPANEFESARQFLDLHTQAKKPGAQVKIRDFAARNSALGKTLVVNGASTIYECQLDTWEHRGSHVVAWVADGAVEELGRAISDSPQSAMQINDNERGGCGMREIELFADENDPKMVTIRHSNQALASIMNRINTS